MNFWDTLNIQATNDIREIKRAYARQLQIHHPEDDPEGFMHLRAAYEQALQAVKLMSHAIDQTAESSPETIAQIDLDISIDTEPSENAVDIHEGILAKLQNLYVDFWRRVELAEWESLFEEMNIHELYQLRLLALPFFNEHNVLPVDIWVYLDAELDLADDQRFLWPMLLYAKHDKCSSIAREFTYNRKLDFNVADYAHFCVNAYLAWLQGNEEYAGNFAQKAIETYGKNYLMHEILGDYLRYIYFGIIGSSQRKRAGFAGSGMHVRFGSGNRTRFGKSSRYFSGLGRTRR